MSSSIFSGVMKKAAAAGVILQWPSITDMSSGGGGMASARKRCGGEGGSELSISTSAASGSIGEMMSAAQCVMAAAAKHKWRLQWRRQAGM